MSTPKKNPLATALSIVLPSDPAIDREAMRAREDESLTDKERAEIVLEVEAATRKERKLRSDDPVEITEQQMLDAIEARAIAKYVKTYDRATLLLKPDAKPSEFAVAPLHPSFLAGRIDGDENARFLEKVLLCVRAGCHSVRCASGVDLAAKILPGSDKQKLADDEWLITLRDTFGQSPLYELGLAVMNLSRLTEAARPTSTSSAG